ncbi:hypothetical protein IGI37_001346 [Enterococcus sp. AZ194]|uniref:hypothetical protein n=1 Tax=Enterococcus sp. AZ194 TaxID=2774629 RepID=UPI003F1F2552
MYQKINEKVNVMKKSHQKYGWVTHVGTACLFGLSLIFLLWKVSFWKYLFIVAILNLFISIVRKQRVKGSR